MKLKHSILIAIGLIILMYNIGCVTTQYVSKPDPLSQHPETARIILTRTYATYGTGRLVEFFDNGKPVGKLSNGKKLIWDRPAGTFTLRGLQNSRVLVNMVLNVASGRDYRLTYYYKSGTCILEDSEMHLAMEKTPYVPSQPLKRCKVEFCPEYHYLQGLCEKHFDERKRSSEIISKYFKKTSLSNGPALPDLNELALILKNGIDLNYKGKLGTPIVLYRLHDVANKTLIYKAPKEKVDNHMKKMLDMFIENGLQITEDCDKNIYAVIISGMSQYLDALMNYGYDSCRKANIGSTSNPRLVDSIDLAEKYGHYDLVEVFVKHGSKKKSPEERVQLRLVGGANSHNNNQILAALNNGAKINMPDIHGEYALIEALSFITTHTKEVLDTLNFLIKLGANPSLSFNDDYALNVAVEELAPLCNFFDYGGYDIQVINTLIEAGALISKKSGLFDRTPLHIAAEKNCYDIARILVESGAKVMILDGLGKTPLDTAESGKIIKLLKENGAIERGY
jgi:ankyrin repeat protein